METIEINGQTVRIINIDGEKWYIASDIAKCLGYKRPNNAIKQNCKNAILKEKIIKDSMGRLQNANIINQGDILRLIFKSKTISKKIKQDIVKLFRFEDKFIFEDRKEILFLDQLERALEPLGIKGTRQYPILNYRIDYYIPSLNIAVEYDENSHNHYTYEQHGGRQVIIEKELGCKFIRVTDDFDNSYNIGLVIKNIFNIGG